MNLSGYSSPLIPEIPPRTGSVTPHHRRANSLGSSIVNRRRSAAPRLLVSFFLGRMCKRGLLGTFLLPLHAAMRQFAPSAKVDRLNSISALPSSVSLFPQLEDFLVYFSAQNGADVSTENVLTTRGRCVPRPIIKCCFVFDLLYSNTFLCRKALPPYFIIEPLRICETQMFVQLGDGVSSTCYKLPTPVPPFAFRSYFPQDDRTNT